MVAFDYSTPAGQVRLLIADTSSVLENLLFDEGQIDAFLDINAGDVRLAAADALDTIATSEVLVSKKIRTQDLATDGPAVAAELRARAQQLRDQAASDSVFDIVFDDPDCPRPTDTVWGL